jgi:D-glycero-D-manno-heptose 1,7-bisphosphate phosphatase
MNTFKNKALFLDRDGVVNKEKNYLYKIEDFEFIDGVFETCRYFQDKGYLLIIITNQAGIARGKYTEEDYQFLTSWMIQEFEKEDIVISKVYHCPHHPNFSGKCECRKPNIGMILQAQQEFDIDLSQSILVGDKNSDIEAGVNAGIGKNYLVKTGYRILDNKYNVNILKILHELKNEVCNE